MENVHYLKNKVKEGKSRRKEILCFSRVLELLLNAPQLTETEKLEFSCVAKHLLWPQLHIYSFVKNFHI